jgi:hypothetical protein
MLTEITGLSALTIGVILLIISAAYVIGFCTGYQLGTRDTKQEMLEHDKFDA